MESESTDVTMGVEEVTDRHQQREQMIVALCAGMRDLATEVKSLRAELYRRTALVPRAGAGAGGAEPRAHRSRPQAKTRQLQP